MPSAPAAADNPAAESPVTNPETPIEAVAEGEVITLWQMMQSGGAGDKITSIELVNLTPEDVKKATTPMDGPTGKVCLNLKQTKKLVIKVEKKDSIGSS